MKKFIIYEKLSEEDYRIVRNQPTFYDKKKAQMRKEVLEKIYPDKEYKIFNF